MRVLLLNADFTPLHFISAPAAITLYYKGRAEVVEDQDGRPSEWEHEYRSPTTTLRVPATLRLKKRVNKRWRQPRFRKRVLFNRDGWRCQFCGTHLSRDSVTVDHVMPSSRGGETTWLNCVSACKPCNKRKADRTPEEARMHLLARPQVPSALHFWDAMRSSAWHPDWDLFVPR